MCTDSTENSFTIVLNQYFQSNQRLHLTHFQYSSGGAILCKTNWIFVVVVVDINIVTTKTTLRGRRRGGGEEE